MADAGPDLPPTAGGSHRPHPEKSLTTREINAQPVPGGFGSRLIEVEARIMRVGRDLLIVGIAVLILIGCTVALGLVMLSQQDAVHRIDSWQTQSELERVDTEQLHREALCRDHLAILGGQGAAGREDYAAGEQAYDQAYTAVRRSAVALGCTVE